MAQQALMCQGFLTITTRHVTVGRTPLDEWSARRRDLNLITHNNHKKLPRFWRGSNPQSHQASGRRPMPYAVRLLGSAESSVIVSFGMLFSTRQTFAYVNTLRTGEADLRFHITTVQDGWRKSAFLTRACFPCTIHLIMQYTEPVSEWSCWRMFIETWPHSELIFRHRASSI